MDARRVLAGEFLDALARVVDRRPPRCVHEDDRLGLPDGKEPADVVDMEMHPRARPVSVTGFEEGALGDHDARVGEFVAHEVFAGRRVARVGDERDLALHRDLDAARPELAELLLREAVELLLELAAPLDRREPEARHGVLRRDRAQRDVRLDRELALGREAGDLEGRPLPLERLPRAHHRAQRLLELGVAEAAADGRLGLAAGPVGHVRLAADLLEVALAEPVRQSAEVVHVRVAQRDRRRTQRRARADPDVEADVEFGDLDRRRLAGDADSLHAIGRQEKKTKLALAGRGAGKHWLNSFVRAFARAWVRWIGSEGRAFAGAGQTRGADSTRRPIGSMHAVCSGRRGRAARGVPRRVRARGSGKAAVPADR